MNPFNDREAAATRSSCGAGSGARFSLILERYCSNDRQHVTVPEGTTQILPSAFMGHGEIETITLPESLESIGGKAFAQCSSLREIVLPPALFELGQGAFCGCVSLERVVLAVI